MLTVNQKSMIAALASNEIGEAKRYAIACLEEDNTKKNQQFVEKYINEFGNNLVHEYGMPSSLLGIASLEDCSKADDSRFHQSALEKKIMGVTLSAQKVSERMAEMGLKYQNTLLLYGDSGTGKTFMAHYIAKALGMSCIRVSLARINAQGSGEAAKAITELFNFAAYTKNVLLLDEIDCLGARRGNSGNDSSSTLTTVTLMQELDGVPAGTVVIGTTNRIDLVDPALVRRFARKEQLQTFKKEDMVEMIAEYLSTVDIRLPNAVVKSAPFVGNQAAVIAYLNQEIAKGIEAEFNVSKTVVSARAKC